MIEIKSWVDGSVLFSGKYTTIKEAVVAAVRSSVDLSFAELSSFDLSFAELSSANLSYANLGNAKLRYVDLRYANLRYVDLRYANLRYADLSHANLSHTNLGHTQLHNANLHFANLCSANLRSADLSCANLRRADLSFADLSSAELRYADLRCVDLSSTRITFQSHDLLSEILKRAAGDDVEKLKIAGYVLVCRDKCWEDFINLAKCDPLGDWALDELVKCVRDGDNVPKFLRDRKIINEAASVQ